MPPVSVVGSDIVVGRAGRPSLEETVEQQREQASDDAMMSRIGQAVMLHHGGDREEAQGRFLGLWAEIGEDGDPLHRCTLAHYMADTQDDPSDELAWDLRALSAADSLTQERLAEHEASLALRAFYPSLHLNLAADYVKLDRPGVGPQPPDAGPCGGGGTGGGRLRGRDPRRSYPARGAGGHDGGWAEGAGRGERAR